MSTLRSLVVFGLLACSEQEPPGAEQPATGVRKLRIQPVAAAVAALSSNEPETAEPQADGGLGGLDDNLPFEPTGEKLGSIAWRTWVYTDTGPKRTRYGYLRAGAVLDARGPAIHNAGCAGGWYRINPRGFVCIGKGATLDLNDPVVVAASRRPLRGAGLPYVYAMARESPPHLYFRLPSARDMKRVEGAFIQRAADWRVRAENSGALDVLGELGPPPEFLLATHELKKPYGVAQPLHYSVHAGRASPDSGFAIATVFSWEDRGFGLTTEHDVIALDRTQVVVPSSFRGIELGPDEDLPVAFIKSHGLVRYERNEQGNLVPKQQMQRRQAFTLTGETQLHGGVRFLAARDGSFIAPSSGWILEPRTVWPSVATGTRKWIDVSIRAQTLVAYEGRKAVYATLVSTGRGGLGDPEEVPATIRGTFMIHAKHVTSTMNGDEDTAADSFSLRDVPFVQYFHKGFALHGTYWHDDFGKIRSHGCINLAPADAAWLFEWTDPQVPRDWHAMINKERGTVVHVRP